MSYGLQSRNPSRHVTAIGGVVLLHLIIGYALLNGLARKVVEIYEKPVPVTILAAAPLVVEPPAPPVPTPPPPVAPPPKPKPVVTPPKPKPVVLAPKPKPPAPRPRIAVEALPRPPTPPAPPVRAPAPVKAAPVAPAAPVPAAVGVVCPNHMAVRSHVAYPALAQRQGLSGEVLIEFTVGGSGGIGNISVLRASNPMFESAALSAVRAFHCSGQGHPVRVRVPFTFRIDR